MKNIQIETLRQDERYLVESDFNIWVMDNHKWALYVWVKHAETTGTPQFTLVHADYHWDCNDDVEEYPEQGQNILDADPTAIANLIESNQLVKYDSFIAPAVRRGMFNEIHFFCRQEDEEIGINIASLTASNTIQYSHETVEALASCHYSMPVIFDLCLDLFNRTDDMIDQGDIWSDEEILDFLNDMKKTIREATLVTVSLSFGYSGTENDTKRLAGLVLPLLHEFRNGEG